MRSRGLTRRLFLAAFIAPAARAEFVNQPQGNGELALKWRQAAANFYKGIAEVKLGIAAIENDEGEKGLMSHVENVFRLLGLAQLGYKEISAELSKPRLVEPWRLPAGQVARINGKFHSAGISSPPKDERMAAKLAGDELQLFLNAFKVIVKRLQEQLGLPAEKRVTGALNAIGSELKAICDRLEDLGLLTAELLTALSPEK
jgi:hypothetical protein